MARDLRGGAVRDEHTEVDEPCTAVELGVGGLDEPWVLAARRGGDGLEDDVATDDLGGVGGDWGAPAEEDGVAVVPDLEDTIRVVNIGINRVEPRSNLLELDGGLSTLAGLE